MKIKIFEFLEALEMGNPILLKKDSDYAKAIYDANIPY